MPLTIATPSTIAIAVSAARSLRPSSPLSATRRHRLQAWLITSSTSPGLALGELLDDQPVGEEQDPVGDRTRRAGRG